MKQLLTYLKQLFCRHRRTFEIFVDYQERYVKSGCEQCGKIIYKDI